jgi:DNA polymerase-3 subunit gamma/tau
VNDIVKKLSFVAGKEGIKVDNEILEAIARYSEGHMRDAESVLGQIVSISGKEIKPEEADLVIPRSEINEILNLIGFLAKKDASAGIRTINKIVDSGADLKSFVKDLIEILRKILIIKINPSLSSKVSIQLGEQVEAKVSELSSFFSVFNLLWLLDRFNRARQELKESFIAQMPIEMAVAEACFASSAPSGQASDIPKESQGKESQESDNKAAVQDVQPKSDSVSSAAQEENTGDIEAKWNEFLVKIKKHNHSLSFILMSCRPRPADEGKLSLVFKYKVHKDRVSNPEIKNIIENTLNEVYQKKITIEPVLDENLALKSFPSAQNQNAHSEPKQETVPDAQLENKRQEENNDQPNQAIDDILKTFGGKIVK